jgi:hypothetical protein
MAFVCLWAVAASGCVNLDYPPGAQRNPDGGPALHRLTGLACAANYECQSGFCVDGFCCQNACTGTCVTCARPGSEGRCTMEEQGKDRHEKCNDEGATSCGLDGACDGAGACERYPVGFKCKEAVCNAGELTQVSRCDDAGKCITPEPVNCKPFVCSGTDLVCLTQCTEDRQCGTPNTCSSDGRCCEKGVCGQPLGSPCQLGGDCASGFCAGGTCCSSVCNGLCESCGLEGSKGTCTPVPAGTKPDKVGACATMDPTTCQTDGTCDGAGACRLHVAGKACGDASCAGSTLHAAPTCDGKGHCVAPAAVTCGGYTCLSGTTCRTTCAADLDCATPSVCGKDSACGGLTGQYFRTTNLTDLALTRTDPRVDFNWGLGAPPGLNADSFSVRWHGKITARFDENYVFFAGSDDGERLIINGVTLIDRFTRHASVPEDVSKSIALKPGVPNDFVFEYFENGGDANVKLSWQSSHEPKAIVPTSAFSPQ